ncbi:MAG: hypothetical protein ACFFEU_08465 [Candidatus Thorarchaeota archaeon]|jgi:sporulation protein YlmC with PRC-barrel domain
MKSDRVKWLLKGKVVRDFRGFPLGRVKQVWYDDDLGPQVVIEKSETDQKPLTWEIIPLRAVDRVEDYIRLKPPAFAE